MGKSKSDYFFIHFANCRFEKKELLGCFNKMYKYFHLDKYDIMIRALKLSVDEGFSSKYYASCNDFITEIVMPDYKSFLSYEIATKDIDKLKREEYYNLTDLMEDHYYNAPLDKFDQFELVIAGDSEWISNSEGLGLGPIVIDPRLRLVGNK